MKKVVSLNIRVARPEDFREVVPLMVQAMEELACAFANANKVEDTYELFAHFFQKKENQYSFDHTLVYEEDGVIMGSITTYDGKLLPIYRKPFMEYIAEKFGVDDLVIEDETAPGEVYIDTVSVSPNYQGKGIGKKLIAAAMDKARVEGHEKIGLLVDFNNPNAKKLYSKLGFQSVGRKKLGDGDYEHLQLKL
ncbi:GNAT family N-acetyltransferase [Aequorivita xiaoshiensis]|uniref:GNAT family N-acetyltransferase n=1 Tax=Aequorivita xiaoshiensis TaxID=2874476 RepID=A0A9X1QZ57_9FLAO|nr:GNAT family N-acetyltransferase [Aequorivita xiaoshiensis]MCG2429805.1 GNAT family N-acetyltransferase [Aequorivita xiaoshiensis]